MSLSQSCIASSFGLETGSVRPKRSILKDVLITFASGWGLEMPHKSGQADRSATPTRFLLSSAFYLENVKHFIVRTQPTFQEVGTDINVKQCGGSPVI